ncbi:hypothetical protein ACOKM5_44295 [Streptomyces sp. BH097]
MRPAAAPYASAHRTHSSISAAKAAAAVGSSAEGRGADFFS